MRRDQHCGDCMCWYCSTICTVYRWLKSSNTRITINGFVLLLIEPSLLAAAISTNRLLRQKKSPTCALHFFRFHLTEKSVKNFSALTASSIHSLINSLFLSFNSSFIFHFHFIIHSFSGYFNSDLHQKTLECL